MRLERYNQNLRIEGNKVISYITHVATIEGNELHQLGYWSMTTQKHINYVAKELNLKLIK
jgi:hypothetical protein|tara:strand:+ start:2458 stop:2637 length:180 start_codon:yes stop_codon:yes gene_type:complete